MFNNSYVLISKKEQNEYKDYFWCLDQAIGYAVALVDCCAPVYPDRIEKNGKIILGYHQIFEKSMMIRSESALKVAKQYQTKEVG